MDELLGKIPLWSKKRGREEWSCGTPAGGLRLAIRKLPAVQVTAVHEGEYVLLKQDENSGAEPIRQSAVKGSIGGEQAQPATQKHVQGGHEGIRHTTQKRKWSYHYSKVKAVKVSCATCGSGMRAREGAQ